MPREYTNKMGLRATRKAKPISDASMHALSLVFKSAQKTVKVSAPAEPQGLLATLDAMSKADPVKVAAAGMICRPAPRVTAEEIAEHGGGFLGLMRAQRAKAAQLKQ